jgi:hypothetical protein
MPVLLPVAIGLVIIVALIEALVAHLRHRRAEARRRMREREYFMRSPRETAREEMDRRTAEELRYQCYIDDDRARELRVRENRSEAPRFRGPRI